MPDVYTTVDKVLLDTCHGLGDTSLRKYALLLKHAERWLATEYTPSSGQALKTVLLDVGPDRVAELPADYLDFVVVGRQQGERIRTLAHNPKLSPLPPAPDPVPALGSPVALDWPAYVYTGYTGGSLTGYGWGEFREEFTVDVVERTLRLSSLLGPAAVDGPLFLQYVGGLLCPGTATPLHPYYADALELWVLWHLNLRKGDATAAANYERLYYVALRKARRQLQPFSAADLRAIIRQSYNQIR
ncbi:MAG: hypothetical protein NVS3B25_21290 [Hymenobacter sp.]